MSEQELRSKCACSFIGITRTLDGMRSLVSVRKEPNWKLLSLEVESIDSDDYKICFDFDATKRIDNLKKAIKDNNRKETVRAIEGLRELESLCVD